MSTFQKIGDRIEVLIKKLGKTVAELEKGRPEDFPGREDRLLGNATISGWVEKDLDWTSSVLEKFLTYWNVDRRWWKSGEGEIFITSVPKASDNKELSESVYRTIVEGNTEYVLVPRTILNETQLISKEELAKAGRELERKNKQIDFYQEQFSKLMDGLELTTKPTKPKKV